MCKRVNMCGIGLCGVKYSLEFGSQLSLIWTLENQFFRKFFFSHQKSIFARPADNALIFDTFFVLSSKNSSFISSISHLCSWNNSFNGLERTFLDANEVIFNWKECFPTSIFRTIDLPPTQCESMRQTSNLMRSVLEWPKLKINHTNFD